MPSSTYEFFKYVLLIQIFFGISISAIAYSMPDKNYVSIVTPDNPVDIEDLAKDIEGSLEKQTDIPLLDVGAMIFYTGSFVLDLILNTIFAIPEMATVLVKVLGIFLPIDAAILGFLSLFVFTFITVLYAIAIIAMITSLRSSGGIGAA